jgi:hypothetical protein
MILTCKYWYDIIIPNTIICPKCNKIEKMYDDVLWITDPKDTVCHGYYGDQDYYSTLKDMLYYNYKFLKIIERQSIGLCVFAIKCDSNAFKYVKNIDDKYLIELLKTNHKIFPLIQNPTYQIYRTAVESNGYNLKYIPIECRTHELCMIAVKSAPYALEFVENQTEEICLESIKTSLWYSDYFSYIKNPTEKIYVAAYKRHAKVLNRIT